MVHLPINIGTSGYFPVFDCHAFKGASGSKSPVRVDQYSFFDRRRFKEVNLNWDIGLIQIPLILLI